MNYDIDWGMMALEFLLFGGMTFVFVLIVERFIK